LAALGYKPAWEALAIRGKYNGDAYPGNRHLRLPTAFLGALASWGGIENEMMRYFLIKKLSSRLSLNLRRNVLLKF